MNAKLDRTNVEKNHTSIALYNPMTHGNAIHEHRHSQAFDDFFVLCRRRWLLIGSIAAGCTLVAMAWSFSQTPVYQGRATVVIDQQNAGILERDKVHASPDVSPEYFATHFELMRSRTVLQRTAQRLNLKEQPEYNPALAKKKSWSFTLWPSSAHDREAAKSDEPALSPEAAEDRLLKQFGEHLEIMPVRGARLAHILAQSEDPALAALAVNTLANVYIERTQELSAKSTENSATWFMTHVDELRKKVEASQQALYVFRTKHGLRDGRSGAGQQMGELESELVKAEMKKAEAQSRFQQIQSVLQGPNQKGEIDWSNLDASTEVLSSPLIQNLRAQEIKGAGDVAELSDKYGPLHPKLARAKAELEDLRGRIQHEVEKVYDSVKHEYNAALVRERTIKEAVGRHRHEKIGLEQYEIERGILEREAESNQHLFDIFLKLTKEADVLAGMRSASVYLADPAVPSSIPVKPRKVLNTALGLLLGLMSGFGTAMFLEFRKRILRVPDDVERFMPSVSLLGVVPIFNKQSGNGRLLLSADSSSPVAESVRIIRTGLLMSNPNQLPACVLVTSPGESEGKTTLAVNLATVLSQLEDTRVILLDVDFRKPTHHQIFGLQSEARNRKGLVDYLKGNAHLDEIIHRTDNPRLWVVPRGSAPERPSDLLHSKRMTELLNWCRKGGYLVILDAPPVLPVADPLVLASKVDGVLLVVSSGTTTMEACRTAIQRLTFAGGKILGAVMQKTAPRDVPYYYSYYSTSDQ